MDELISDNGPQYASRVFCDFMATYNIRHTTSSLHPQSNDLAEKAVQTIKAIMKKCQVAGENFHLALLDLRITPRDPVLGSPVQRLMARCTKTRLPTADALLQPNTIQSEMVQQGVEHHRQGQKHYYDRNAKPLPPVATDTAVHVHTPSEWKPAEYICAANNPQSNVIKAGTQGRLYRRNRQMIMTTDERPHNIPRNV